LSKTKRVLGSSEQSPRRDKTSGKQRIQKMRDAAEASKSSIAKKEYKSFTVTTKSGNEIPHKVTKDFLSSRSTKTLATPKLKVLFILSKKILNFLKKGKRSFSNNSPNKYQCFY